MRKLLLALMLAGGLCSPALAQSVIYQDLSGSECWNAGQGPGGPSQFLCTDVVRNSRQVVLNAVAANVVFGTGALAQLRYGGNLMVSAAPATANVTAPPNPVQDGAIAGVCNGTAGAFVNTLTFVAGSGQSLIGSGAIPTQPANSCVYFQFNRGNTTWYRIT